MKKLLTYIVAALVFSGMVSCEKSLDVPNPNEADESNFWKSENDAILGINAVYGNAYRNGAFARWLVVYLNPRSDDGLGSSGWPPLRSAADFTTIDLNFEAHRNIWDHHYRGVYRANQVLAYVPEITMNETLKGRILAEAKFFRALYYFNLVNLWGNIPLVLTPSRPTDLPAQASQETTWAQIERDLSEAAPNLPTSYSGADLGRVTRGAAYAMLGKAYLQQRKYQQAAEAFNWLVEGEGKGLYELMPNYRDNFLHTTENNRESVFEIQFKAQQSTTDEDAVTSNLGNQRGPFIAPPGGGFNDVQMHRWVVYEFLQETTITGARDPRLESTAMYDSTDVRGPNFGSFYGRTFAELVGNANDKRVWYRKYLNDYHRNDETFEGPINLRVIRYADVLLMYAECLNALGRTAEAYPYVDRVRQRAGLATLTAAKPGLGQEAFLRQLMHERVTELTGEDVRWLDLARWGYFDDEAKLAELRARDPEFNNFQLNKHKWLPIPQTEIDINANLTQNPNWR
jgi:starch-binding outer membrane protein, SusD/RagB family